MSDKTVVYVVEVHDGDRVTVSTAGTQGPPGATGPPGAGSAGVGPVDGGVANSTYFMTPIDGGRVGDHHFGTVAVDGGTA